MLRALDQPIPVAESLGDGREIQAERHGPIPDQLTRPAPPMAVGRAGQLVHQHLIHLLLLGRRKLQTLLTEAADQLELDQLAKAQPACSPPGSTCQWTQHAPVHLMQQLSIGAQQRSACRCVELGCHDASCSMRFRLKLSSFGRWLQPVRGLVRVEPRWRKEAAWLVRAGEPGGSGGSPSKRLTN